MLNIKKIRVKKIISPTNLANSDYGIDPYVGCEIACSYCYVRYIGDSNDNKWGSYVFVKENAPDLIIEDKAYDNKTISIGTLTDPYQFAEKEYEVTRKILEKLISFNSEIAIITKSDLVLRDIDLLKKFKDIIVAISLSYVDDKIRKELEPKAISTEKRIKVLKELHSNGIKTALFIDPIFPGITDWKKLVKSTRSYVDKYLFENLNIYPSTENIIFSFLKKNKPELIDEYKEIYSDEKKYWRGIESDIKDYCEKEKINYVSTILNYYKYYHSDRFSSNKK